ncbi:MAG: DUF7502 family protein [Methermicoccaceae archaeon]
MYAFVREIKEFKNSYKRVLFSLRVLDGVVAFLGTYLVLAVFQVPFMLYGLDEGYETLGGVVVWHAILYTCVLSALVATAVVLVISATQDREDAISMLGERYVRLRDRLACAYDNRQLDNVFMRRLSQEVDTTLHGVSLSDFFYVEGVLTRVGVLLAIVLILTLLPQGITAAHVAGEQFGDMSANLGISPDMFSSNENVESRESTTSSSAIEGGSEVLYGQARLAELKGATLDLTMYSGEGTEVLVRDENTTKEAVFDITPQYPVDVVAYETYTETLPSEHMDIVSKYFEMLTEEG